MATIEDVLMYFCQNYPYASDLSKARIAKMVYLADWRAAIILGRQITEIEWTFNHYGPYVEDVVNAANSDQRFLVEQTKNYYGDLKEVISLKPGVSDTPCLSSEEEEVLQFTINNTKGLTWNDFIKLVYSTYPVMSEPRYSKLDLVSLAREYKDEQAELGWVQLAPV